MAVIHPDSQRLSDRFHTRGNLKVIICICFFIAIITAPLPGPSTSLCDRPHVLSESQGRYVAGSELNSTVGCTDRENRLASMHHRDTDICVSLCVLSSLGIVQNFKHKESVIKNAVDVNYTNLGCRFMH